MCRNIRVGKSELVNKRRRRTNTGELRKLRKTLTGTQACHLSRDYLYLVYMKCAIQYYLICERLNDNFPHVQNLLRFTLKYIKKLNVLTLYSVFFWSQIQSAESGGALTTHIQPSGELALFHQLRASYSYAI
jgi:hypothetical protein